jgi:hypothetical protein
MPAPLDRGAESPKAVRIETGASIERTAGVARGAIRIDGAAVVECRVRTRPAVRIDSDAIVSCDSGEAGENNGYESDTGCE